jgi:hypothetical protein
LIHELGDEKLMMTYWICALSINQHTVACDKCEPVEWQCKCRVTKITSGPTSEIGAFDIMMRVLTACDPQFYQVVATDKRAIVVNRVWVVAEIAEAIEQRLRQKILPHFPLRLSGSELRHKLKVISLQACEATEARDRELVLNRINQTSTAEVYDTIVRDKLSSVQSNTAITRIAMLLTVCLILVVILQSIELWKILKWTPNTGSMYFFFLFDCVLLLVMYLCALQVLINVYWSSTYHYVFVLLDRAKHLDLYDKAIAEVDEHLRPWHGSWGSGLWLTICSVYLTLDCRLDRLCRPWRCNRLVAILKWCISSVMYWALWTGIHVTPIVSVDRLRLMLYMIIDTDSYETNFCILYAKQLAVSLCFWLPLYSFEYCRKSWAVLFFVGHLAIIMIIFCHLRTWVGPLHEETLTPLHEETLVSLIAIVPLAVGLFLAAAECFS